MRCRLRTKLIVFAFGIPIVWWGYEQWPAQQANLNPPPENLEGDSSGWVEVQKGRYEFAGDLLTAEELAKLRAEDHPQ